MKKLLLFCLAIAFSATAVFAQNIPATKFQQGNKTKVNVAVDRSDFFTPSGKLATYNQTTYPKGILLHENANIVTHPGQGAGGLDYSWAWDDNTWGLAAFPTGNFAIACNFDVLDASWTVDSVRVYAYQSNSGNTSTLNDVRIQIWDGNPNDVGSAVIWGDTTTNRMTSTRFTNCYRGTDFTNTARPIMVAVCNTPALTLTQGFDYWIEYSVGGTTTSGPWAPPIMAGADIQRSGNVYSTIDSEMPVDIFGTAVPASCPTASNITITNLEDVSATIGWTENGTATTWLIEYGPAGFTPGSVTPIVTTTNPHNLTGLTAGTSYDVIIRAFCAVGDTSIYSQTKNFQTLNCPTADLCAYSFELTDDYGDGWNGAAIEVRENGQLVQTITMGNGTSLIVPALICDGASVTLTWVSGSYDEECVLAVKDPYGTVIFSFGVDEAPAAAAVFHSFTSDCSSTCFPPTALTVTAITLTGATLNWTDNAGATSWDIEWGIAPFTQGTGTMITATTTKPYILTGLTAATSYAFYVRAVCGASDHSGWAGPFAFNTLCSEVSTFPWTESFEGTTFPPVCWTSIDQDADGNNWEQRNITGWAAQHGTGVAVSASWDQVILTPDNYLVTPAFNINSANLELSFWVAAQDVAYPAEKFSVLVSTSGANVADFTATLHTEVLSDSAYKKITLPLGTYNGQTIYIAFRHWDCTDQFFLKLDNVKIDIASGINETSNVSSVNIYPNPVKGNLNINATNLINNIKVVNTLGQIVANEKVDALNYTINTSDFKYGVYFIQIETAEGIVNKSFVVAE
ncbi:MAG: choice-of-anchor J domain-containing protein [Bacteroidales bacterium]|nr:choice-of-anchor J domain-containing protein [Bacteroidales bacterium]